MKLDIQQLKEIATKLSFQHHHNIGAANLTEQLTKHCETLGITLEGIAQEMGFITDSTNNEDTPEVDTVETTPVQPKAVNSQLIERLKNVTFANVSAAQQNKVSSTSRDAMKLVRCKIYCNNPNKNSLPGEVFTAQNAAGVSVTKFVSFNVPTHIPTIMYNMLKERQCQVYKKERLANSSEFTSKAYQIMEYTIEVLPPLTKTELEAIAKKQLAEGFTGE